MKSQVISNLAEKFSVPSIYQTALIGSDKKRNFQRFSLQRSAVNNDFFLRNGEFGAQKRYQRDSRCSLPRTAPFQRTRTLKCRPLSTSQCRIQKQRESIEATNNDNGTLQLSMLQVRRCFGTSAFKITTSSSNRVSCSWLIDSFMVSKHFGSVKRSAF